MHIIVRDEIVAQFAVDEWEGVKTDGSAVRLGRYPWFGRHGDLWLLEGDVWYSEAPDLRPEQFTATLAVYIASVELRLEREMEDARIAHAETLAKEERRKAKLAWADARTGGVPAGRRAIPREVKYSVYQRDGGRCVDCGTGFDLQYDDVIPLALGGSNHEQHLQLLCGDCNRRKGATLG